MTKAPRLKTIRNLRGIGIGLIKHAFMLAIAVIMLGPLMWMFTGSLKTVKQTMAYPPEFIPNPIVWSNFVDAWNAAPFGRFMVNTFKIAVSTAFGTVLTSAWAAYAFARLQFRGKSIVFGALLARFYLHERVNPMRWGGTILVCAGVALVVLSL